MTAVQVQPVQRTDSLDSLEGLDLYFASYVPFSNLPTPPPAPISEISGLAEKKQDAPVTGEFAGPAAHLVNLVPSNACARRPSLAKIHGQLSRADLPVGVIALAASILDAISFKFARIWRTEYLSATLESIKEMRQEHQEAAQRQLDSPTTTYGPEVIILAAISLAAAYLDDRDTTSLYWVKVVADDDFTVEQLNTTCRCILLDIDYALHDLSSPESIHRSLKAMHHAGSRLEQTSSANTKLSPTALKSKGLYLNLSGTAMFTAGLPTPEPSPMC